MCVPVSCTFPLLFYQHYQALSDFLSGSPHQSSRHRTDTSSVTKLGLCVPHEPVAFRAPNGCLGSESVALAVMAGHHHISASTLSTLFCSCSTWIAAWDEVTLAAVTRCHLCHHRCQPNVTAWMMCANADIDSLSVQVPGAGCLERDKKLARILRRKWLPASSLDANKPAPPSVTAACCQDLQKPPAVIPDPPHNIDDAQEAQQELPSSQRPKLPSSKPAETAKDPPKCLISRHTATSPLCLSSSKS